MPNNQILTDIKSELKGLIRNNSDRGFLHYGACNRVCAAMITIVDNNKMADDPKVSFEIHLFVLIEVLKLIAHADTSSGAVSDVVSFCLSGIKEISESASEADRKVIFHEVIKACKNKVFLEWEEYGYQLLRSAVSLVKEHKEAEKVYQLFPLLGTMYGDKEYPDRYLITQDIIERLDGVESAEQYRMEHIQVPEIRRIVVERAMLAQQYRKAEELCLEVLHTDKPNGSPSAWAYYLERIYAALGNREKQIEVVRLILMSRDRSFYSRLKELYLSEGVWEQQKELVLQQLSKAYMSHEYAALLSEEGEWGRLLEVVQTSQLLIEYYGKPLSRHFPEETYAIYEAIIWREAAEATDRRKYKGVCKLIKGYFDAGAKEEARSMIQRLIEKYPRRTAMVDELGKLNKKVAK